MPPSLRNLCIFPLLLLISYLQPCHSAPAPFINALPSLETVQTAMERAADYGYQMLGYGHHEDEGYGHHDHFEIKDKPTLWDGHIVIPDFVSPIIAAMPDMDGYGYSDRVVKGHDGRLGFRLAVPYFGDLQYIREYGPGRFTDGLGPGHYHYPGLDDRPAKQNDDHYGYHEPEPSYHYGDPKPDDIYFPQQEVYPEVMYEALQNYPWNVVPYSDPKPKDIHVPKPSVATYSDPKPSVATYSDPKPSDATYSDPKPSDIYVPSRRTYKVSNKDRLGVIGLKEVEEEKEGLIKNLIGKIIQNN